jgi:uncharacterized protein with LGFP repeats
MPSLRRQERAARSDPAVPVPSDRLRRTAAVTIMVPALLALASVRATPVHAAPVVFGAIAAKWQSLRGTVNDPGEPLDVERPTYDGEGRAEEFQNGTISWHPNIGAFYVKGDIRARWFRLGREDWGYPITDELMTPKDTRGRYNHFAKLQGHSSTEEKSIYWTPQTRAVEVYGPIREFWGQSGWENGRAIFPYAPEKDRENGAPGRKQLFEGEPIIWTPTDGAAFPAPAIKSDWPYRVSGVQGYTTLEIDEFGAWKFSGTVHDDSTDPMDVAIVCAVRASSGVVFQYSAQGHVKAGGTAQFPPPGQGPMAGQDMRIATAWPAISRGKQISCSMGVRNTGTTVLQDVAKVAQKSLGVIKQVIEVVKAGKDLFTPAPSK